MAFMRPEDVNLFNTRKSNLRAEYGRQSARNVFDQGQARLDFGLAQRNLTNDWDAFRNKLPGQFAGRGLMNSGVYTNALQEYAQNRQLGFEGLGRQFDKQMGGYAQQALDLESRLQQGLNMVEAERQARRAELAAQLRSIY